MIRRKLLHEQVAEILREEIRTQFHPGDRLDSDTKQAQRFSTSVITIRDAMRLLCQEGLLERKHGSGTYVKERPRSGVIALVASEQVLNSPRSYYFLAAYQRVKERLENEHWKTVLHLDPYSKPLSEATSAEVMLENLGQHSGAQIRGVINVVGGPASMNLLEEHGIPVVGSFPQSRYTASNDHVGVVRTGTRFLIEQGRRKLALLQPLGTKGQIGERLLKPFREELKKEGLPCREDWASAAIDMAPGSCWENFRALWKQPGERPDGLMVAMDSIFPEAVTAILSLGIKVPQDLLVVTHANKGSDVLYPFPTLRLECDPQDQANRLVDMLLARIKGEPAKPGDIVLPYEMVGRQEVESALKV